MMKFFTFLVMSKNRKKVKKYKKKPKNFKKLISKKIMNSLPFSLLKVKKKL